MPLDRTAPAQPTAHGRRRPRFTAPRGLVAGTIAAAALVWGQYVLLPGSSLLSAQVQTGIYLALLLLTCCSRRAKVLLMRTVQRYVLNPLFRLRAGLRYRWVNGTATIRPGEDPLARQRKIIAWHPLRALNAVNVRVFGADLLAVHVRLHTGQEGSSAAPIRGGGPGSAS